MARSYTYPSTVVLHPIAHLVQDVVEKPVEQSLEIGQRVVVRAHHDVAAEEEQHHDPFARDAIGEKLIQKLVKLFIVDVLNVDLPGMEDCISN